MRVTNDAAHAILSSLSPVVQILVPSRGCTGCALHGLRLPCAMHASSQSGWHTLILPQACIAFNDKALTHRRCVARPRAPGPIARSRDHTPPMAMAALCARSLAAGCIPVQQIVTPRKRRTRAAYQSLVNVVHPGQRLRQGPFQHSSRLAALCRCLQAPRISARAVGERAQIMNSRQSGGSRSSSDAYGGLCGGGMTR